MYYKKGVWCAVCGHYWVCGGGWSPEPAGQRWSAASTNKVITIYRTLNKGGFAFIS